jgi:hypothetical protein
MKKRDDKFIFIHAQDVTWFGPHDRLFVEEESHEMEFVPGPEYGASLFSARAAS